MYPSAGHPTSCVAQEERQLRLTLCRAGLLWGSLRVRVVATGDCHVTRLRKPPYWNSPLQVQSDCRGTSGLLHLLLLSAFLMPWDHSNVRSWELSKAATGLGLSTYRSGLYKRAVVLLQAGSCDSATRTSAAHSLQQAVENAYASCTADSRPAPTPPQLTSNRETHRRETHNAKILKQQLRRQRQEQRHEQTKLLWQQRHEEKIKHRHEQLEQQVKQQGQQQVEAMQQLEHQKRGLYQQLQQHKQDAAAIMEAIQNESKDMVAAPLESLRSVQQEKLTAEEQLTKV